MVLAATAPAASAAGAAGPKTHLTTDATWASDLCGASVWRAATGPPPNLRQR